MLTIKVGNACRQLYENVHGGNVFMLLDCKAPCFNCITCNCTNPIWQVLFFLVSSKRYIKLLGNSCCGFCHWLYQKFETPLHHYFWFRFAFWQDGTLSFVSYVVIANKAVTLFIDHCYRLYVWCLTSHCVWMITPLCWQMLTIFY